MPIFFKTGILSYLSYYITISLRDTLLESLDIYDSSTAVRSPSLPSSNILLRSVKPSNPVFSSSYEKEPIYSPDMPVILEKDRDAVLSKNSSFRIEYKSCSMSLAYLHLHSRSPQSHVFHKVGWLQCRLS